MSIKKKYGEQHLIAKSQWKHDVVKVNESKEDAKKFIQSTSSHCFWRVSSTVTWREGSFLVFWQFFFKLQKKMIEFDPKIG